MKNKQSKYQALLFTGLLLLSLITFNSCEDPIEVPSQFEESQLVVDAWLTNTNAAQTIILNRTVDYFEGGEPETVENASITVCEVDSDKCFGFLHVGNGRYVWQPQGEETFGSVGDQFVLDITVDGNNYRSITDISRTVRIDSIGLEFEEESLFLDEGFYAEVYAFDPPGRGDTYWIRAYKNDTLLNRPIEQVVAWDATFDAGADIDGTYFIPPLRFGINPVDDDGANIPYVVGDEIYVEVHSINEQAFRFLNIAVEQITNEGIFALPLANSQGNITNEANGERILGIFNIAEVASLSRIVE